MAKIFLWGSYDEGNFGDDLMAALIGAHLLDHGHAVTQFGTERRKSAARQVSFSSNVNDAVSRSDVCIIGGGEFLSRDNVLRRLVRNHPRKFEAQCLQFLYACETHKKHFFAVSIGGDGTVDGAMLSPARRRLFSTDLCMGGTVRLRSDILLAQNIGLTAEYYPDILLATPLFCRTNTYKSDQQIIVGINLSDAAYRKIRPILYRLTKLERCLHVRFIRSHTSDSGHDYEVCGDSKLNKWSSVRYSEIDGFIHELAQIDIIVSSKLHVGLVAASYGATFISYEGKPKAKLFIQEIAERRDSPRASNSFYVANTENLEKLLLDEIDKRRAGTHGTSEGLSSEGFKHFSKLLNVIDQGV